ncbi:MAG: signal peptidase I [Firmicutes bacterium]|nr:signal peptidase I [Bacillota bacterium]MBR6824421.1 signal peptidase I [Bacillota bacterium]MBR7112878.1 signal peptidase I [Bacillota bacterium]
MAKQKAKSKDKQGKSAVKEFLMIFLMAAILAVFLKCFIVDSRVIPSSSMVPTIQIGDRVVLNKLSYLGDAAPQRGDIVVFKPNASTGSHYDMIKRVIGLPGDRVEINNGYVYINGEPLEEDYLAEAPRYYFEEITVPEGCYFLLGDNRNYSNDAHMWLDPFVTEKSIEGKATLCYWPLSRIGSLYAAPQNDAEQE